MTDESLIDEYVVLDDMLARFSRDSERNGRITEVLKSLCVDLEVYESDRRMGDFFILGEHSKSRQLLVSIVNDWDCLRGRYTLADQQFLLKIVEEVINMTEPPYFPGM